jgi:exoribonuclease II
MGGEAMGPEELAELFFADTQAPAVLAIRRVLSEDFVYFKQKKGPRFEPRGESQVEDLRQQREAELEKERERQAFIDAVAQILAAEGDGRRELAEQKMGEDDFRRLARIIQKYAVHDSDYKRHEQAVELLDDIEDAIGRGLPGSYNLRAFRLMVELTVWDEHENLHLLRRNISTTIDDEIVQAAHIICERSWEPESWRKDLSGVRTFSVDSASTRDIDDALSCERLADGGFRVGVHIADPSARVAAGCDVDLDARGRGTSIYLPTGNFPMFPRKLSHDKMSLVAGQLRPAMSTLFRFNEDFELVDTELVPSMVEVDDRLTYAEVDRRLSSEDSGPIDDALHTLRHVADDLMQRRVDAGAVSIDLPDLKLKVDLSDGTPRIECGVLDGDSAARGLVSELMVLNNRIFGEFCRDHDIPTIYRCQDPPEEELYDDAVMSVPEGLAREFALVRKMKPGDVTTEPAPHFGLGLPIYVQASSPIRRYSDLVCQRQIKAFLADEPFPYGADDIMEVLATVENTARDAKITERETTRYWTLYYLGTLAGEPLEATVVEHKDYDDSKAAVFVHDVALKTNCKFRDRPAVGEVCQVEVRKADPRKDMLHMRGVRD